jgi:hypothetical protein
MILVIQHIVGKQMGPLILMEMALLIPTNRIFLTTILDIIHQIHMDVMVQLLLAITRFHREIIAALEATIPMELLPLTLLDTAMARLSADQAIQGEPIEVPCSFMVVVGRTDA